MRQSLVAEFEWMLALDSKLITFLDLATLKTIGQVAKRGRSSEFSSGRADLGFTHPRTHQMCPQGVNRAPGACCEVQFCIFAVLLFAKKNKSGERIRAALHLMIQHRHPLHHCWWLSLLKYEQPALKLIIQIINMIYTRHIQQYQNNLESAFHYLGITNQF